MDCFEKGDLHRYEALCVEHAAYLNAQPALVAHERRLREKITILCLLELVFATPPDARTIPLAEVAARAKLSIEGVEALLMRCLSLHLIEGSIDAVEGVVHVTWITPRVLTEALAAGGDEAKRAFDAMMGMTKIDVAAIEAARRG